MQTKFNYGKIFLLGFGFFGVSVIWGTYNAFVPIFLSEKFGLSAALIGFFMTLDNIAALLIQPPVGAWSDKLRTPIGRRMPFILIGAPIGALAFGLIPVVAILPLFVACTSTLLLSMALWRTPVVALMLKGNMIERERVLDLGPMITGDIPGRTSDDQRVFFSPIGMGIHDICLCRKVYEAAKEKELGTRLKLFGT